MRNKSLDIVRSAVILYIITIIHGAFWLNVIPYPHRTLLLFEMPLIFMISGYSYAIFETSTGFKLTAKSYRTYVINRSSRVLMPYVVYTGICAAISILLSPHESQATILTTILAWINPFTYGVGHSVGLLNEHLWFMPPFLFVMLLIPLVTTYYPCNIPLWLTGLGVFGVLSSADGSAMAGLKTPLFYLFWAYLGYIFSGDIKINRLRWFLFCLFFIVLLLIFSVGLNMQLHKFPPNAYFFVFCLAWVSFFLCMMTYIDLQTIDVLADVKWLKPFIVSSYSIYLWQGLGYSVANTINSSIGLPVYVTWLLAVILTLLLGITFSPIERIRLRITPKKHTQQRQD